MITENELQQRFHFATGSVAENNPREYYLWIEELLLKYMNEEKEFDDIVNSFEIDEEFTELINQSLNLENNF